MLKTDFLQMGTLLELLRGGLVPAFRFEVSAPQSGAESPVTGWSMDFSFEILRQLSRLMVTVRFKVGCRSVRPG